MKQELIELYQKTIPNESLNLIPLELVCNYFGISYERQYRDIDNSESYEGLFFKSSNEIIFGDKRKRGHLNKKGFMKWIMQMNPTIVNELIRSTFFDYQNNIIDYFYDNAIQHESVLKSIGREQPISLIYVCDFK
jgi:hypothetical protein